MLFCLSGCATLASVSSGQVGCPPSAIKVSDYNAPFLGNTETWTAVCNGKTYYCTKIDDDDRIDVSCKPAAQ